MIDRISLRNGGELYFASPFLLPEESEALFRKLRDTFPWKQERSRFGPMPRLTAWYAEDRISYSYSGVTHVGVPWTPELLELKSCVEEVSDAEFNSALLNLYRDGRDSMGWHADDESELGVNPVIASVSLGATRRFKLKHRDSKETINLELTSGSLLVMAGTTIQNLIGCSSLRPV